MDFIKRYKHHDDYVKKSKTITKTAKPENFTDKLNWIEWYPFFIYFLPAIMGRNGIPLSYICKPVSTIVLTTGYGGFIDEYVDKAPLTVQAYLTDAAEVHTYIIKFTSGNPVVESKMLQNSQKNKGRCMVDVDEESDMAEEAGKTWYINGSYTMPEWYSVIIACR